MNLEKLFEMQKQLDLRIEQQHPRQKGEDRLAKKILALQVELGELANEWRIFKYWSYDREPRTVMYRQAKTKEGRPARGLEKYNPLLEELVDCLHFILSIGLDLRMDEVADELDFKYASGKDTIECFVDLYSDTTNLYYYRENDDINSYIFESIVSKFIRLGEFLGFTLEQIEQGYYKKNSINHERQKNGY